MKRTLSLLLAAVMLALSIPFSVAAADPSDLPYITSKDVMFINYAGSDDASGASASSAKKSFGAARSSGAMGSLGNGGTLVASGKAFLSKSYTLPTTKTPLLFTSLYAGENYMKATPATNPDCAFKMASGAQMTIQSDVILDNIIVFQEHKEATALVVKSGATLVIGKNVKTMSKTGVKVQIIVENGGRLIVADGDFEFDINVKSGGEIVESYSYEYLKVSQEAVPEEDNSDLINVPPAVAYIAYNAPGSNKNDGLYPETPKKQMLKLTDSGALSVVAGGGTLVACGRLYIGGDYTIPKLGSQLTITGAYGGVNYVNADNVENPASGMIKMLSGKTLTIEGDVRLENIILFQESTQNTIKVAKGGTLTIGEGVQNLTKQLYTMKLVVEQGGTVIFETTENTFDTIEGDGMVIMPETLTGGFEKTLAYDGRFTDVPADSWFYEYVKTAYEYALAKGQSATKFGPGNKFTVAEALTAAANINSAFTGKTISLDKKATDAWYAPYVNYCLENGIIVVGQFTDFTKNITRGDMARVFAKTLPDSEYTAVRNGSFPDVSSDMACYDATTKLYNAGIIGGDDKGRYNPNNEIVRSEACVIFTRLAAKEYRAK